MTSLFWINVLSSLSRRVICWVISRLTRFMISIIVFQCLVNFSQLKKRNKNVKKNSLPEAIEFCQRSSDKEMILMKTLPNKKLMIGNCMRLFIENQMINLRRTKMKPWHLRMNKVMVVMRMNLLKTDNSINDTKFMLFQVSRHILTNSTMT